MSRLFPYGVTVGAMTVVFLIWINIQTASAGLVPQPVWVLTFVFFALYLTGLIETSIQLFGAGAVSSNCSKYVKGQETFGASIATLAYLEQNSICESCLKDWERSKIADIYLGQSWYASFAFWIVGVVFLVWLFIMAIVVNQNSVDRDTVYRGIDP